MAEEIRAAMTSWVLGQACEHTGSYITCQDCVDKLLSERRRLLQIARVVLQAMRDNFERYGDPFNGFDDFKRTIIEADKSGHTT